MVVTRFVIRYGLKRLLVNVAREAAGSKSSLIGLSVVHKFKERLLLHRRGVEGSTVKGLTRCGGDTSPTLPQTEIAPEAKRSKMAEEINLEKGLQDILFIKTLGEKVNKGFNLIKERRILINQKQRAGRNDKAICADVTKLLTQIKQGRTGKRRNK